MLLSTYILGPVIRSVELLAILATLDHDRDRSSVWANIGLGETPWSGCGWPVLERTWDEEMRQCPSGSLQGHVNGGD